VALTYSELDRLQQELIAAADADGRTDKELLKQATLGTRAMRDAMVAQFAAKIASRLHHHYGNELVRQLCRGALINVLEGRQEAREILTFALQLIQRASHASPSPTSLSLPEPAAVKAREYLETCLTQPARLDTLTAAARAFVLEHDSMAGGVLFARFLSDLEFLRAVVGDENRMDDARKTAAGALTYFVEAHDAVADGLGVVGILDDAYIAQFAAEKIDPKRRTKTAFVDALLAQWPFLARLRLGFERGDKARSEWSPSEFVLLNLAVGFGPDGAARSAIVLPDVGGLPLSLGVLASLGILQQSVKEAPAPYRPPVGDFVAVAGRDEEVIEVSGYFQPPGGKHSDAALPENARLVALRYPPRSKKAGGAPVKQWRPVEFLDACVPASARGARRTTLPRSPGDVDLGPLERLFGGARPLRFENIQRRVVVVGALGVGKALLENAEVFARPLTEVIPCGRTLPDEGHAVEWWSARHIDGLPVLTLARDMAEAAAIVSRHGANHEVTVIAGLDKKEWDAAALVQLGDARVVAIVPQWQAEAQAFLSEREYRFLDWTKDLERTVARRSRSLVPNELDEYERVVRRQLAATVTVHEVDSENVELGMASLKDLGRTMRSDYGDEIPGTLAKWALGAQRLFFELNGTPIRITGDYELLMRRAQQELRDHFHLSKRHWTEQSATAVRSQLEALDGLMGALTSANPKESALAGLLSQPDIAVRCDNRHWQHLLTRFPNAVRWLDERDSIRRPAVVFHWPGWKHVARMVLPPIGDPTHLVFYGWERDGMRRVQASRQEDLAKHWTSDGRPRSWHIEGTPIARESTIVDAPPPMTNLDEWIAGLRRQSVVSSVGTPSEEDPLVEAVPVYFTGGWYALYTRAFDVLVATNLNSLARVGDEKLQERVALSLVPGDVVLVRAGAERDAIRERADARLPSGARDLARTWHGALRRLRDRVASDRAVYRALAATGCTRAEITIMGWLRSPDQIGPHDDDDVDLIAKATSDSILLDKLGDCKAAIRMVRREHHRASHELFVRAVEEVQARLHRGQSLDESIDLGDRIHLLIVDCVDETFVSVARSATNVPRLLS
jgi:uncharacterized membrane protein YkvA (DUF1232 family)